MGATKQDEISDCKAPAKCQFLDIDSACCKAPTTYKESCDFFEPFKKESA